MLPDLSTFFGELIFLVEAGWKMKLRDDRNFRCGNSGKSINSGGIKPTKTDCMANLKFRLTILSFLQFFVWGAWLITIGVYWFNANGWPPDVFGKVFATLGIASIIMPPLVGIVADRWVNAERLYGILHLLYGLCIFMVSQARNPDDFYIWMFASMMCYMPTISLSNSLSYYILKTYSAYDVVKVFPPIRVWGTVGFIAAM